MKEKLNRCKYATRRCNFNDVDELDSIKIDRRKPSNERILDFIMKTKNPYIFKVD